MGRSASSIKSRCFTDVVDQFIQQEWPERQYDKRITWITEAPDIGFHGANIEMLFQTLITGYILPDMVTPVFCMMFQLGTVKFKLTSDVILCIITDPKIATPLCCRPNTPSPNS